MLLWFNIELSTFLINIYSIFKENINLNYHKILINNIIRIKHYVTL